MADEMAAKAPAATVQEPAPAVASDEDSSASTEKGEVDPVTSSVAETPADELEPEPEHEHDAADELAGETAVEEETLSPTSHVQDGQSTTLTETSESEESEASSPVEAIPEEEEAENEDEPEAAVQQEDEKSIPSSPLQSEPAALASDKNEDVEDVAQVSVSKAEEPKIEAPVKTDLETVKDVKTEDAKDDNDTTKAD